MGGAASPLAEPESRVGTKSTGWRGESRETREVR